MNSLHVMKKVTSLACGKPTPPAAEALWKVAGVYVVSQAIQRAKRFPILCKRSKKQPFNMVSTTFKCIDSLAKSGCLSHTSIPGQTVNDIPENIARHTMLCHCVNARHFSLPRHEKCAGISHELTSTTPISCIPLFGLGVACLLHVVVALVCTTELSAATSKGAGKCRGGGGGECARTRWDPSRTRVAMCLSLVLPFL